MVKKIGILTSGGDAPGMNSVLLGAIRAGTNLGKEMYVVYDGYRGLIENHFEKVDKHFADNFYYHGGTIIKTARLPEFKDVEVRKIAVQNLQKEGIEALIVIGGDGSYMGAKKLTEMGINCVGLPGTIDNDIASTDYTIGFDTALNNVVEAIDKIKETMSSHNRCCLVEIMGNRCPDLTLYAAIATNADFMFTIDRPFDGEKLIKELNEMKKNGKDNVMILVSEKIFDLEKIASYIRLNTTWDTRVDILGYIQRGGSPSGMERFNGMRFGRYAIELLDQGIGGVCVGIVDNKLHYYDIYDALALPRKNNDELYKLFDDIK
ncbi:MAG: 6-phosphofructokinase [Bacilli bacterium]|nr:6-phosphofructokinase [Bacilli bacterium]